MEEKPIVFNGKHYTVMANDIIKSKQDMTVTEARVVRLLITQVVKYDKDLKTYTCRIQDFAKFTGASAKTLYQDIRGMCKRLMSRTVDIWTGNPKQPWLYIHWIERADYDGNGNLTFVLSEQLKPYVCELSAWFTQYQLQNILSFTSFYAIRLYELIKYYEGITRENRDYHEFAIEHLRSIFSCENKYETTSEFIRKTIDISVREINDKSDIELSMEQVKVGKKITALRFSVWTNQKTFAEKQEVKNNGLSLIQVP